MNWKFGKLVNFYYPRLFKRNNRTNKINTGTLLYGHDKTIHQTPCVNIEMNLVGDVVAVWFRCMRLPFDVTTVGPARAAAMQESYRDAPPLKIGAISFITAPKNRC